jgi:hypothetical protein
MMLIGGTALQMYGQYQQGKSQSEAYAKQAAAKRIQAYDLLERADYNINQTKLEGEVFSDKQVASFVKSGVEVTGSALLALEETAYKISQNVINQRREADQKANALFMGADIDTQLSGDISKATTISMIGTGLTGAYNVAKPVNVG